jgi:hypothetical protein
MLSNTWLSIKALQVCNDPLTSKLHVAGSDAALANQCIPASIQLGGKMAVLSTILQVLVSQGLQLAWPAHAHRQLSS